MLCSTEMHLLFYPTLLIALTTFIVFFISYSMSLSGSQLLSQPALSSFATVFFVVSLATYCSSIAFFDYTFEFSQGALQFNSYSNLYQFLLVCASLCYLYMSKEFLISKNFIQFEHELLVCFAILGLVFLSFCNDFLMAYLALELQSFCLYVFATLLKNTECCAEASIKYFVLGAVSSSLLLFGFTLFYLSTGTLCFEFIKEANAELSSLVTFFGCFFLSVALFFKLGAFPFHL
jgi:NADH-quinone oxidoreductase subunit N